MFERKEADVLQDAVIGKAFLNLSLLKNKAKN